MTLQFKTGTAEQIQHVSPSRNMVGKRFRNAGIWLPMLWLIWIGVSMTRKATAAKIVAVVEQPL